MNGQNYQTRRTRKISQDFGSKFNLDKIYSASSSHFRRTKIICTIGPACWSPETLIKMLEAGMNVARLNFSHGDHQLHGETVDKLREAFRQRKDLQCGILLDTKGPEIRTGLLKDGKNIDLVKGQTLEITSDYTFIGDNTKIACSYPSLAKSLKVDNIILIADGVVSCIVKEVKDSSVICEVQNDATIGERKNMNLPGVDIDLETITERDEEDIVNFGVKKGVDFVAVSFCRSARDIEQVRDLLGPRGSKIQIIAKIENHEGLNNLDEIVQVADGIMVARGDLGMEIPPEKVFVAQKWIIKKCNNYGKSVITATQMMESIIKNPRPSRAEASDVANAVLDGTDCVMLSGETANGAFPVQAVQIMSKICIEAEDCWDTDFHERDIRRKTRALSGMIGKEAMAASAVRMSLDAGYKCIICFTESGDSARKIAKYRPLCPILAVSIDDHVIKGLCTTAGVVCLRVPSFQGVESLVEYAIKQAVEMKFCSKDDEVIVMHGTSEENPEKSNLIKIMTVS